MITKQQAIDLGNGTLNAEIHCTVQHDCTRIIGPRGGVKERITRVRPSGRCQTWKTRPNDFRLPVKYGMYESSEITHQNAANWHIDTECPLAQTANAETIARGVDTLLGDEPQQ